MHLANVLPLKVLFVVGTLDKQFDDISNNSNKFFHGRLFSAAPRKATCK